MATSRLAHAKGVWRFIYVMASVSAALAAGAAMAEARPTAQSFPERYQEAIRSADNLIFDIQDALDDPWFGCEDLDLAADEVAASERTLKSLIAEADRTGQDIAAGKLRYTLAALSDTSDDIKPYCGNTLRIRGIRLRPFIEIGVVSQDVTGHKQRLAHDVNNTVAYDFANVDQKSSGSKFLLGMDIPLLPIGKSRLALGMSYAYTSLNSSASDSANGPFNAPGLGVGTNPNGFSTNSNNAVSYQYESDSIRHEFDVSAATRFRSGPVYFSPRIGGIFGVYTVDDKYTFNRPSPPSTFAGNYTTNSTVYTVGPYVQLGIDYRIPQSNVTLFGTGKAGFDYNWAKSNVSFELTSPSAFAELQNVSISDTKYTPNLSLEGGFKVDFGPWDAYLKGGIQYGRYVPNISIPGGGSLPMLNGETETEYSITAGLKADLSRLDKKPRRQLSYSDARLKRDIAQVGRLANGLRLYRYRYRWSDTVYVGVMAQEVALLKPNAVLRGPDGFLAVDYGRLGLRMMTWDEWLAAGACAQFPAAISNCRLEDEAG
jgi:Chaperone of endosialidase